MILLNTLAVAAYAASLIYLLKRHPSYLVIFGFLSAMQVWALASCYYNDLGIYNQELVRFTQTTLATSRLALFYIIFNLGFLLCARLIGDRQLPIREYGIKGAILKLGNFKLGVYALIGLIAGYLIYSLWVGGVPIMMGLDRLAYEREASPVDRFLIAYGAVIAFGLGLFSKRIGRFSVNGLIVLAFMFYAVLLGHKFSFLLEIMVGYFAPIFGRYVYRQTNFRLFRARYLVIGLGVAGGFLLLAFSTYLVLTDSVKGASELLLDRLFAGQGEMWWAVDWELFYGQGFDASHWQVEVQHILSRGESSTNTVGMRYLMVQILGALKAYALFDRGYLYTMAYPAILVATVPYWVALLMQLAAGGFMFILVHYLHTCLVYDHHFRALIAFMMVLPFVVVLFTGNLFVFLTMGMVVKFLLLLAGETGFFFNIGRRH